MTRLTQHSHMTAVQCGSPRNLCPSAWSLLAVTSLLDSPRSPQSPFKSLSPKLPVFSITLIYSPGKQIRTWIPPPSLPPKFGLSAGEMAQQRTLTVPAQDLGSTHSTHVGLTPASNSSEKEPQNLLLASEDACMHVPHEYILIQAHTHTHKNISLF